MKTTNTKVDLGDDEGSMNRHNLLLRKTATCSNADSSQYDGIHTFSFPVFRD